MNKKLIISLVMIGVMAFGAGLGTFAWFTSTATSNNNVFETGRLDLNVNEDVDGAYTLNLGTINNMAPGEITPEEEIIIKNNGTLNLAWFGKFNIPSGVDGKLAEALYFDYMKMEFLNPTTGTWEATDTFIENGVGAGTYGDFYDGLIDSDMDVITIENFLSAANNGMGAGAGLQMGALKPGYSYKLTFKIGMAEQAGNEYQGNVVAPLTLTYSVDATQVSAGALNSLGTSKDYLADPLSNHLDWLNLQLAKQTN